MCRNEDEVKHTKQAMSAAMNQVRPCTISESIMQS